MEIIRQFSNNSLMKKIIYTSVLLLTCFILYSCSSTNLMTIGVLEPAPVYVPSTIKSVGIINRSSVSDKNKLADNVDKVLSAEGKNLDKEGALKCIQGIHDEFLADSLFLTVSIIDSIPLSSPGLGILPAQLSWDTIDKLCDANNVDAIFELSFFDTDAKIAYTPVPVQVEGPLGIIVQAIENHVTITTQIKTGWRIYNPSSKTILDNYSINNSVTSTGVGINPLKAVEAVIGRKEAVLQESYEIGQTYTTRLLPYRIRVEREYYVRGTDNFKIAKRRAQTGNWDGAAELWFKETTNPKSKVAGRAYYNMAIISEINGELDIAVDWASKAYSDYNNKTALWYLNELKYRIARNKELHMQE